MEYTNKFFYPALAYPYKNHQLIVDALKLIDKDLEYEVNFTIKKDTLPYVESIYEDVMSNNLNVNFIGRTTLEETFNLYSESVLLFPSEIETFGLPLLEARLSKCIVIALNTPFAREILEGYNNAYLFDSVEEFANLINKVLKNEIIRKSDDKLDWLEHKNLLQVFEQLVDKKNTL